MLTLKDFLLKYESLSDEELYQIHKGIDDYSEEAKEALYSVIGQRGGLEVIERKFKKGQLLKNEAERLRYEMQRLYIKDTNLDFLKTLITSELLSPVETQQIIEAKYAEINLTIEDQKIKPRTIFGSLIGGGIASLIGGALWGLQLIQMHRIFYILIIGLVILSYGLIRLFTKQSKANAVVLGATVISVTAAILIGGFLFEMFT